MGCLIPLLTSVHLSTAEDQCLWKLESNDTFSINSLEGILNKRDLNPRPCFMKLFGRILTPKRCNYFYVRLVTSPSTQDKLQHRIPYMDLSPQWCSMCKPQGQLRILAEYFCQLFFATMFWRSILADFGWSWPYLMIPTFSFAHAFGPHRNPCCQNNVVARRRGQGEI